MAEERQIGIPQEPLDYSSDLTTKPYELDENKKYDDQKHEVISGEIKRTVIGDNWRIPMQFNERQNQLGQVVAGLQDTVDIDSFMAKEYIKWRTDPAGAASGFVAGAALMGTPGLNIAVGGGALLMAAEKSFPETFGALKPEQSKELTRSGLEDVWNKEIEKESQKLSKAREDLDSGKISQLQFDAVQRNFDNLVARRQTNLEKVDKFNATVKALDGVSYPNKKIADASVVAAARFLEMRELNKSIEMAQKGIDPESTGYKVANIAGSSAILAGTALGANYLARYGLSNTLKRITTDVETTGGAARLATIKPVRSRREAAGIGKSAVELTTAEMESAQYTWENIKDYIERTGDKTLSEFNPQDLHAFMGSAYGAIAGKIETMGGIENIAAGGMRRLGIGGFWRRVLTTGGEEAVEEGAQSLTEFLSRKIDNTTDKTFGEALEDALNSAAWGGFMGLGFGTIGGVTYRNARKQGVKVLQEYGLSRDTAEKVFDNMVDQVSDANSPQNETVRDKVREKVATIYENADLSPVELEDTIESITDLEMAFIAYDSAENGIDIADNPILQGEVNQIGWFREGIPEQVADQVRALNDEIAGLRQQLREENTKETKDFNKIDDLEAKIEQFYAKLPKEVSDIVETDRAKVRQMLDEQMARARDLQDRRKVVRQVQQRALKALQREQESDVQKSLRRLQEQTRTEEQKARAEERKQWQEQRKLRKAIEKLRQDINRRKSKLPVSQELFADADLVYQALRDSGFTDSQISTMAETDIINAVMPYGISPQILKQSDLAAENARLDDIYPEYTGETIDIFDYDTTSVSDWADKNIEKQDSFETDEGVFTNYKLVGDNRNMPTFTVFESRDGWIVRNAYIPESEQNKGIGTKFYQYMNLQSIQKTGKPLRSTQPRKLSNGTKVFELSDLGKKLWDSLTQKGLATKNKNGTYQFNKPQERTVYNSDGNRIAKSKEALTNFWRWFGNSKVVDEQGRPLVVYHQTSETFNTFERGRDKAGKYDYETPGGFFFKSSDRNIGIAGNIQMPVYLKAEKTITFDNRQQLQKYWSENIDGYADLLKQYQNVDKDYNARVDNIESDMDKAIDDLENSESYKNATDAQQYQMRSDLMDSFDSTALFDEWRNAANKIAEQMKQLVNDYVSANNIEMVKLENDSGAIGKKTTDSFIVFEPNQIKSVDNRGTYSADTGNIYKQTKVSGKGKDFRGFYAPELRLISLAQNADPTTLAHELAHDWMQQFFRHYRSGRASESFMKSWGAVEKALGITENDITVPDKASEAFARAYEGWILNNKDWAKNIDVEDKDRDKMIEIFKRYQGYLTDVYEDLNNPYFLETWGETGKLKPELQAWFDKVTNPTDLIDAQVQTGKITPEQAQTKQITRTVNEVVQAVENEFTPEEKEEIAAVERMNDTSRYEVEGGNKNSLQNRLSGLARDIDANNIALKRYDTHRDMLEVAKAADDFVRTRRDEAINIINGIEPEKEGLYASDLYTALERFAVENNDVDLALELTNSKVAQDLAKEWGQRIAGFRNFTGDGDFDVVSQLKSLDNKFKKDYDEKGKQRVETAANEYVEELNKADDLQDVDAFLDSIKCQ